MTTAQLKTDIDNGVSLVEKLDSWIPGTAKINSTLDTLKAIAENAVVLTILADALTAQGL